MISIGDRRVSCKLFSVNNVQPVIPFDLNDDWNLVTRTILPIISQPGLSPGRDRETGIGNILITAFFVPKESGKWTWGVGPAIQLPTASDDVTDHYPQRGSVERRTLDFADWRRRGARVQYW